MVMLTMKTADYHDIILFPTLGFDFYNYSIFYVQVLLLSLLKEQPQGIMNKKSNYSKDG